MDSLDRNTTGRRSVTPTAAGLMLGVSDQQVDRLLLDGRLPTVVMAGSGQRRIRAPDVERLVAKRADLRAHTDAAIEALLDNGLEY